MTLIGNPQNLLIALQSGMSIPFITFIRILGIPTIINLFVTFFILKIYFKTDLVIASTLSLSNRHNRNQQKQQHYPQHHSSERDNQKIKHNYFSEYIPVLDNIRQTASADDDDIVNPLLAKISIAVLLLTIARFILSETFQFIFHFANNFSLSIIAMLGDTVLYAISKERREILVSVDYSVLVFFAAMFVFTTALWSSGIISYILSYFPTPDKYDIFQSNAAISIITISLSQVLSNVPFVALYNNIMINNGFAVTDYSGDSSGSINQWMMLAVAGTIAGNLTIFAAASNIIDIETTESKGLKAFSFVEFSKIGVIVTIANIIIYYRFIGLVFA